MFALVPALCVSVSLYLTLYVPFASPVIVVPVAAVQPISELNLYSIAVVKPVIVPSLFAFVVQAVASIPVGALCSAFATTSVAVPTREPVSTLLLTTTLIV